MEGLNLDIIRSLIAVYKENWPTYIPEEEYKWAAFEQFKSTYYQKHNSRYDQLSIALSKAGNLLSSSNHYAYVGLLDLIAAKPLRMAKTIDYLYDDSKPYRERVVYFKTATRTLFNELKEQGYKDWKSKNRKNIYQDVRAISVYLSLRFPEQFYLYKPTTFDVFAKMCGYVIKSKNDVDKLFEYEQMCDIIKGLLKEETNLLRMCEERFGEVNLNLLTQDMIYTVATHIHSSLDDKKNKKKSLVKEPFETMSAEEFIREASVNVKPSHIDFSKKDEEFRSLGEKGEQYVVNKERKRLGVGEDVVKHISRIKNTSPFDIESVEDDGVTPRYIEVKTTTGDMFQPFYFSDKELQFSEEHSDHYYLYRVYKFEENGNATKIKVIPGSLKQFNAKPVKYQVSFDK